LESEDINIDPDKVNQTFSNLSLIKSLNEEINLKLPGQKTLSIKWMEKSDISEVLIIEKETFPAPWSEESFLYRLGEKDHNLSLVGAINGRIAAYAVSYIISDELHFMNLAVTLSYRRNKIGQMLLLKSLRAGKEKKCQWVHLEVRKNNTSAIQLYEKFGFKSVGVRKNYYEEENEDALLMSKSI
jgi:[ribosomal protein S18]-alanine N-acetyltransferase